MLAEEKGGYVLMFARHRSFQRGVSMMEVMVAVAILAILAGIGVPSLSSWIQNTQVRATAESLLSALQLARAEAVRQNLRAQLLLTDSSGMASWTVITEASSVTGTFPASNTIQTAAAKEAGQNARLGVSAGPLAGQNYAAAIGGGTGMNSNPPPGVIFDAFGRVVTDSAANAAVTRITRIDVTNSSAADARRMVITVSDAGLPKMCDPSLVGKSQGCN